MTHENKPYPYWTPQRKAAHGELTRASMAPADVRRRISEGTRRAFADPAMAARHRAAFARPETRLKISIATKAAMAAEDVRERIRVGMVRARYAQFETLRAAWAAADKRVRLECRAEIERELQA
ncbi:MAG: hypothetical protein QOD56_3156 [Gammaproteobacteria bacterium]|nr:hypothetical protein [Gammaproteobacteria bacterium]